MLCNDAGTRTSRFTEAIIRAREGETTMKTATRDDHQLAKASRGRIAIRSETAPADQKAPATRLFWD